MLNGMAPRREEVEEKEARIKTLKSRIEDPKMGPTSDLGTGFA